MNRKTALRMLAGIAGCLAGRWVIAEEKPKEPNNPILDEHGNAIGYQNLSIADSRSTGIFFHLDDFMKIEVSYKGKTKLVKPQELFDAL